MVDLLVGADPEMFVFGPDGKPMSGYGMIPGTKKEPHKIPGGAVQVDGTALEFNIEPSANRDQFVNRVTDVMRRLRGMIPKDHELHARSAVIYDGKYFQELPREARELGCDPDYNAWLGTENIIEEAAEAQTLRTAAGHIHIGWAQNMDPFEGAHFQTCCTLVKELDITLGLPSVIMDPEGHVRRSLYGKAGAFRPKPYGAEYRVLSNFWLKSPKLIAWVFDQVQDTFNGLLAGRRLHEMMLHKLLIQIINDNEKSEAADLIKFYGLEIPDV